MKKHQRKGILLSCLAWATLLLPLFTTHLCFFISASYEHIPWCNPYWDQCVSISATGRQLPEKLIFKSGMITTAFISLLLWWGAGQWCLLSFGDKFSRSRKAMQVLGLLAALFLIQYTLALGEAGNAYRMLRRTGVILTIAFTFISQVLMTRFIGVMIQEQGKRCLVRLHQAMLTLLVVLLTTAMFSLVLDVMLGSAYKNIDDAFEWIMVLMLYLYFGLLASVFHRQPLRLRVEPAGKDSM
ncbi:MAG TPA: hypothetical protein VJ974_09355 [Geopsychrobacteraceae bacterium]|nr:hypothetical protein [Geopsychrobacteraceae bacterium]